MADRIFLTTGQAEIISRDRESALVRLDSFDAPGIFISGRSFVALISALEAARRELSGVTDQEAVVQFELLIDELKSTLADFERAASARDIELPFGEGHSRRELEKALSSLRNLLDWDPDK